MVIRNNPGILSIQGFGRFQNHGKHDESRKNGCSLYIGMIRKVSTCMNGARFCFSRLPSGERVHSSMIFGNTSLAFDGIAVLDAGVEITGVEINAARSALNFRF